MTTIFATAHHRNGVGGEGFTAVTFAWDEPGIFLAIISDTQRYHPDATDGVQCFVTSVDKLPNIEFGTNSYRGDQAWEDLLAAGLFADDRFVLAKPDEDSHAHYWSKEDGWGEYWNARRYRREEMKYVLPVGWYWVST